MMGICTEGKPFEGLAIKAFPSIFFRKTYETEEGVGVS